MQNELNKKFTHGKKLFDKKKYARAKENFDSDLSEKNEYEKLLLRLNDIKENISSLEELFI